MFAFTAGVGPPVNRSALNAPFQAVCTAVSDRLRNHLKTSALQKAVFWPAKGALLEGKRRPFTL
jgi:hypothetical protein